MYDLCCRLMVFVVLFECPRVFVPAAVIWFFFVTILLYTAVALTVASNEKSERV